MFSQGLIETYGSQLYYSRDHLGSIREVVDKSGHVVAKYQYSPFGVQTKLSGSYDSDLGYAGYINGPFLLAPFRAYDPHTGRWLSRDPIGEKGGVNLYGFVANSPLNKIDSLGLYFGADPAEVERQYRSNDPGSAERGSQAIAAHNNSVRPLQVLGQASECGLFDIPIAFLGPEEEAEYVSVEIAETTESFYKNVVLWYADLGAEYYVEHREAIWRAVDRNLP